MKPFGLLLLVFWGASAWAGGLSGEVRVETLGNGLTVLLAPDSLATAVDVGMWYDAGVRTEKAGRSGLTYVLGRMIFLDADPRPAELRRRVEAEGGMPGLTINPDFSGTSETLPPEALDLAIELEAERAASFRVTGPALSGQVEAVREEYARRLAGGALGQGAEKLFALTFAGHPYARPAIGRGEDVGRVTLAEAEAYWRERFNPSRALLTVVGKFDAGQTLELVRRRLGSLPRGTPAARERAVPPAAPSGPGRASITAATQVSILMAGWRGPGDTEADSPAFEVLARLLALGNDNALARELVRSQGPIAQIQGNLDRRRDASLLYVMAAVPNAADTATAEQQLIDAVERRALEPVPVEDLERARRQVEAAALFAAQTARGRAQALVGARMLAGDWQAWERRIERVRQLTAEDVQRVAARVLVPGRRGVVWVQAAAGEETK